MLERECIVKNRKRRREVVEQYQLPGQHYKIAKNFRWYIDYMWGKIVQVVQKTESAEYRLV